MTESENNIHAVKVDNDLQSTYCEVPNSCAVWNNSVGWQIHPN